MPQFKIDLSRKAVDRLQFQVQRTNEANGTSLTLREWLELHAREIAIADDLAAATGTLQQEAESSARDALNTAIRAKRDEFLAALDDPK